MKKVLFILIPFILIGCTTTKEPTILYKTEFKEVKVPVMYKLNRPNRPKYTKDDNEVSYLLKLIKYVKELEVIIDKTSNNS